MNGIFFNAQPFHVHLCFRWVHVSLKCSMAVHFISTTQPAGYIRTPEVHSTGVLSLVTYSSHHTCRFLFGYIFLTPFMSFCAGLHIPLTICVNIC